MLCKLPSGSQHIKKKTEGGQQEDVLQFSLTFSSFIFASVLAAGSLSKCKGDQNVTPFDLLQVTGSFPVAGALAKTQRKSK